MSDLQKKTTRLFIKVPADWLERFEAYCEGSGMKKSGAVRAALEKPMKDFEAGKEAKRPEWETMTLDAKIAAFRDAGSGQDAIRKVAETFRMDHDIVQRFAYRNKLMTPPAVAAE